MASWDIKHIKELNQIDTYISLFKKGFPKRSYSFFKKILLNLDNKRSILLALELSNKQIVGVLILFKVEGYDNCWAPSYFFVHEDYRSLGIPFLIKAQKYQANKILNITPNDSMCSILDALRYSRHTQGSKIRFNFSFITSKHEENPLMINLKNCKINQEFLERKDLTWLTYNYDHKNILMCFKKVRFLGLKLQILVFSKGFDQAELDEMISRINRSVLGLSIIIYPAFDNKLKSINLISKKFRVYGNFSAYKNLYSILGSEVTEIL